MQPQYTSNTLLHHNDAQGVINMQSNQQLQQPHQNGQMNIDTMRVDNMNNMSAHGHIYLQANYNSNHAIHSLQAKNDTQENRYGSQQHINGYNGLPSNVGQNLNNNGITELVSTITQMTGDFSTRLSAIENTLGKLGWLVGWLFWV